PCNFKENKESEIETIPPNICNIDASAINFLEGFLSSYHLLQENITIKYFIKLLYLFEARNIRFDQKFVKIIEILVFSLLKTGKSDADNFQEEMVNGFRIDLLSEECSFFVFKILFKFLFPSLKIKDIDRFSSSTYMQIPSLIREKLKNKNFNKLSLKNFRLPSDFDIKKGTEVQKNMISLIFYILNFKMIEIWLSSIEQIPVLLFILSLHVGFCEAVILEITEINSSFIDFLNECSFFKTVKKILIFGGSIINNFDLNSVHLPNLETLSLFMKDIMQNDIMESDKFTKPLKMATEAEIKDSKISPEETPIDNKKEKHSAESDKYSAFTLSNPSNTTKIDIYSLNTSISVFHFMGNKVLLPKNFLTLINVMKNLETLKIEVCDLQFLPIFTDICDVPKKVLKSLIIIVASEFSTMYLYFIRSFLVLESLILKSKVLSKIRYDFSDVFLMILNTWKFII
ncbi:hypothetical protein CWI36_2604p0010, partial [Hamiltosporidium magnivora]